MFIWLTDKKCCTPLIYIVRIFSQGHVEFLSILLITGVDSDNAFGKKQTDLGNSNHCCIM